MIDGCCVPLSPCVCYPFFPTGRTHFAPFSHRVGVVFYRDAANYHCKRPVPVKVAERMGFRYDFQKKRKSRGKTEKEVERGVRKGYKSPWSPIKFMNLDLDRSSVVTVLKYFFCHSIPFSPSFSQPHPQKYRRPVVSGVRLFAVLQLIFRSQARHLDPFLLNRSLDTKP